MVRFKDFPIKQKILAILMFINMTTLVMVFGGFLIYNRLEIRQTMIDQTVIMADVMAYNCATAVLFNDAVDAQETLSFLETKPSIISAQIFTEQGTVLANYVRPGEEISKVLPEIQKDGHYFKKGSFDVYGIVKANDQRIGTIHIQSDKQNIYATMQKSLFIAMIGLLFAMVFSGILAIRMQRAIVNPILELEALSKSVSKNKDYSVRGSKHGNDEIGFLVEAFNEMLHQIELQNTLLITARENAEDSALEAHHFAQTTTKVNLELENQIRIRKGVEKTLQKHRANLEVKVVERTKDLQKTNDRLTEEISERVAGEKIIQNSLDEKVLLLREIHHRVKNNLQMIASLLDLTRRRTLSPEAQTVLADARSKIYAMGLVHSQLYQSESFIRVDMAVHIRKLLRSISQIYATDNQRRVLPQIECSHVHLSLTQAIPFAIVLNELISNVYKHAYPGDLKGECFISMSMFEEKQIHFRVRDQGVGIPENFDIERTETLGLKLIQTLVRKQLKGEVRFDNSKGMDIIGEFDIDHDDVLIHGRRKLTPDGFFPPSDNT